MITLKSLVTGAALSVALFAVPNSAQAQAQIYVNPYGGVPYSGYSDLYYGGFSYSGVPYSYYNDGRHHYGPHKKLHWTGQEGLHWGRHYGRHHIGGHDFRYPRWY
jgi:hypothetical protein